MSRSKRKNPIMGWAGGTTAQKAFKKQEHQRERSIVKDLLKVGNYDILPHPKQFGNEWDSPRDGKGYFGGPVNLKWYWNQSKQSPEEYIQEMKQERKKWMRK